MPRTDYTLLFDDGMCKDMAQYNYDSHWWMGMQHVPVEAVKICRSKKKFD